jgi:polyribonucleotide nucleotidyltransferase
MIARIFVFLYLFLDHDQSKTDPWDHAQRWDKTITFATGKLAPHCDGAVVVSMGETKLLVTAVINKKPDPSKSFTPLAVDFREVFYAAGKIGGGRFNKREGRPGDEVVLYSRLIDRALRPLFPKGMTNDVIVTITPLSLDLEHNPGELAIIWSSVAIMMAGIPLDGPVGATRIAYREGQYITNPTESQMAGSLLDLHLAGPKSMINMVEAGGDECPMDILKQAFVLGQEAIDQIIQIQQDFLSTCTISPKDIMINFPSPEQMDAMEAVVSMETISSLQDLEKNNFDTRYAQLEQQLEDHFASKVEQGEDGWNASTVSLWFFQLVKKYIRKNVTSKQMRIDSRGLDDIR